ncbi:hypothetical protein BGZ70_006248 [Mortierella alpina]|uniref:Thioredoxin domain-containing protein n=1 Tax=Mortierella alpina TaxID=64518 RepID=A0A9P6J7X5_MORAP|nr:hypothetical protein BGZ70_006248 [Mortierella alpina]
MPPPPDIPLTETEALLIEAYNRILNEPFEDKYEDLWEDEPFDRAVEEFRVLAQEIGVDPNAVIAKCEHVSGPVFSSKHRVVLLDFWASWCDPCVQAGPDLSDLADEFNGRMAVVGINNESIFGETKSPKREYLEAFLDDHRDGFRYTIYLDNAEGDAKENVYKPAGYRGIPCVVLIFDGVVVYVGSPQESFRPTLEQVLRVAETEFVRED